MQWTFIVVFFLADVTCVCIDVLHVLCDAMELRAFLGY